VLFYDIFINLIYLLHKDKLCVEFFYDKNQ